MVQGLTQFVVSAVSAPGWLSRDLIVWAGVVFGILGTGMIAMINAYVRPFSRTGLFDKAVTDLSLPLETSVEQDFQAGCQALAANQLRRAIELFDQVIAAEPNCAEAFQNRGRAQANLGNRAPAARDLLEANDRYDQQGTKAGVDQVKQDLSLIAQGSQPAPGEQAAK